MDVRIFDGDVEKLRPLIEVWMKESNAGEFGLQVEPDVLLQYAQDSLDSGRSALIVMESKEGRILGVLGVVLVPSLMGPGSVLHEQIWYVLPEHRSHDSLRMVALAEQIAKDTGAGHLCITASKMISNSHDKMCELYQRLGFRLFETTFIKELRIKNVE